MARGSRVAAALPPKVHGMELGRLTFQLCSITLNQSNHDRRQRQKKTFRYRDEEVAENKYDDTDYRRQDDDHKRTLFCRLQFWGDDSFVDIIDASFLSVIKDSQKGMNVVEYPLVGSIVGVKHYFKDMNILPLLVLQRDTCFGSEYNSDRHPKSSGDTSSSIAVMGYGKLNLVSILNELIHSLQEQQNQEENITGILYGACIHCKVPIISLSNGCDAEVKAHSEGNMNNILEQIQYELNSSIEKIIGELKVKIRLCIYHKESKRKKSNDIDYENPSSTHTSLHRVVDMEYKKEQKLNNGQIIKSSPNSFLSDIFTKKCNRKFGIWNEFGVDETIMGPTMTVSTSDADNEEEDSILLNVMFDNDENNDSRITKVPFRQMIDSEQRKVDKKDSSCYRKRDHPLTLQNKQDDRSHNQERSIDLITSKKLQKIISYQIDNNQKPVVNILPIWMCVEINDIQIDGLMQKCQFICIESTNIKLRMKVSCSLAVASLHDLKLDQSLDDGVPNSSSVAFKEETYSISMSNDDNNETITCDNIKFRWNTPLKIDADALQKSSSRSGSHSVKLESWIQFHGEGQNSVEIFLGTLTIPLIITDDKHISSHSSPTLSISINTKTKLCDKGNIPFAQGSVLIVLGSMRYMKSLPKILLAVTTIQEWWCKVTKLALIQKNNNLCEGSPLYQSVSEGGRFVESPCKNENVVVLHEKSTIIQRAWQKQRKSCNYFKQTHSNYNNEISIDTKKQTLETENFEDIIVKDEKESSSRISTLVPILENINKKEDINQQTSKRCIKIGPISGIYEILMLWFDNGNIEEFETFSEHDLISSGVIITFDIFTKTSQSNYSTQFCSSKVLLLDHLNKEPLSFEAFMLVDESQQMIKHFTKDFFECSLWFIPIVTDVIQQQYPIINNELLKIPEMSKKVCYARCPMKAVATLSTTITYICPWIVSLTKDSEDVETMGSIHISFENTSSNRYDQSLINLCPIFNDITTPFAQETFNWEGEFDNKFATKFDLNQCIQINDGNKSEVFASSSIESQDKEHVDIIKRKQQSKEQFIIQNEAQYHSSIEMIDPNISSKSTLNNNIFDDMSYRNLSSVMGSLDVITAKVRNNLIGYTTECNQPLTSTFKKRELSPPGPIKHDTENLSQSKSNNSDYHDLKSKDSASIVETKNLEDGNVYFDVSIHQNFSKIIDSLNDVTLELKQSSVDNLSSRTTSTQSLEKCKVRTTKGEEITVKMKSQGDQSITYITDELSRDLNRLQEEAKHEETISISSEEKSNHSSLHESSESSISLVLRNETSENWENSSLKSSSSDSTIIINRKCFESSSKTIEPNDEEKHYSSLSDNSSTESSSNYQRSFHSDEQFNYLSSDLSIKKEITNKRVARIMGVMEQKDSEDESRESDYEPKLRKYCY